MIEVYKIQVQQVAGMNMGKVHYLTVRNMTVPTCYQLLAVVEKKLWGAK